jgi:NADPH-dependent glutamate synthase beta subunit-like oxidoreductase
MIPAILAIGGIGCLAGIGLAVASKIFYVYIDPKILAVEEALPGANCGGCGFPGCSGAAEAIATGKAPANICVGGGADVLYRVAEIMGVEFKETEPEIALPGCYYGVEKADLKYLYDGVNDCRAAMLLGGGPKVCPIGCVGLGTCVVACPFNALSMGPDGLPAVKPELCTGCGTCERVCPKNIITLTSNSRRLQQEYTTDECTAPCQRACPAGIDIPAYIYQVAQGNYLEAVHVIKEKNPLPLVCGRICVHPCEFECRRNLTDDSVAINYLKRFASDYEMKSGKRIEVAKAPQTGLRVALVGGGAEGLTAAYFLARLGHEPTVYEAMPELGGLLRTVIPEARLPRNVLDWEIQGILETGAQAVTEKKLGQDFTVDSLLKEGYSAVFVATGGWDTQLASGLRTKPVEVLPGVQLLAHFTLSWIGDQKPSVGNHVMILGGGNASIDAARICLQSGAKQAHVLFRASREEAPFSEEEIREAENEGIRFYFQSALIRMMGEEERLIHVEIAQLEAADEGEGKVIVKEGSTEMVEVDSLLIGAGRFPELIYVPQRTTEEETSEEERAETPETPSGTIQWETVAPYPGPFAEEDIGIFRPGEATTDYKAVVEAIGSGRRAATSVHRVLMGEAVEPPANMIRKSTYVLSVDDLEPISQSPRHPMPELPKEEQIADPKAEIELGYSEKDAREEAKRCLRCGLICYRRVEGKGVKAA